MPSLNINISPDVLLRINSMDPSEKITIDITLGKENHKVEEVQEPAKRVYVGPLGPLMTAGVLKAGDRLAFHQKRADRTGRGVITISGRIKVEGDPTSYFSPSRAAESVTGNVINGWTLWRTADGEGPTLDELRSKLKG